MKIKNKKLKVKRSRVKRKLIIFSILFFLCLMFVKMNQFIEPRLVALAKQQSNNALREISREVLGSIKYDTKELIHYQTDANGKILFYEYNTKVLNDILETSIHVVEASLKAAKEGKKDPILQEVFFEDGVMDEIPIGYFTGINFLQNLGFKLKLDMPLFQYVDGSIKIKSEEYGINNSLLSVYLVLDIKADLVSSMYKEEIKVKEEIPIIIQVVNGEVPSVNLKKKD